MFPHPPYDPDTQRQISAIPTTNTMRFAVTATVSYRECLPCGITQPDLGQPGGDTECLAPVASLDECVVQDLNTGATWSGPCSKLVDRSSPPSDSPFPLLGAILATAGAIAAVGIVATLLGGKK